MTKEEVEAVTKAIQAAVLAALQDLLDLVFQLGDAAAQFRVLRHQLGVVRLQGADPFQQLRPIVHGERILVSSARSAR